MTGPDPQWLTWTKRLQAIAQNGLTYAKDPFDRERYEQLQQVAAEMMATGTGIEDSQKILDLFRQEHGYCTPKIEVRGAAVFPSPGGRDCGQGRRCHDAVHGSGVRGRLRVS